MNLYLPRIVMTGRVETIDIWHGSNLAEPEYAVDYWERYFALWKVPGNSLTFLRLVHEDDEVRSEIEHFTDIRRRLNGESDLRLRSSLVAEEERLVNRVRIETTNPQIASRVLSKYRSLQ